MNQQASEQVPEDERSDADEGGEDEQQSSAPAEDEIPAGRYTGTCTGELQFGNSGDNGTETMAVEIQMPDGDRTVWSTLYFSQAAKEMSKAKLKACGWSGKGNVAEQIRGKSVKFSIKYEEYQGDRKMKVNIFDGNGGFKFKNEMSESARDQFLASLEEDEGPGAAPSSPGPAKAGGKGGYPKDWDKNKAPTAPAKKAGGFSLKRPAAE